MRRTLSPVVVSALVVCLGGSLACSRPQMVDESVTNAKLGIRLAAIPSAFRLVRNEGTTLELAPAAEGRAGSVSFVFGPPEDGVNLVAAVHADQARLEGLPGGEYRGAQELVTPLGPAFYSRGRYQHEGEVVEETSVFALHPGGDRLLTVTYRYPAGDDSASRVEELLGLIAEVGGVAAGG